MKIYSMIGAIVVVFALIAYTFGFILTQRKQVVTSKILLFFTIGVFLDISATALMILGATSKGITLHGCIGYSSLLGMVLDTFFLWRLFLKNGENQKIMKSLNIFSLITYSWWIIAFVTGGILVGLQHHS